MAVAELNKIKSSAPGQYLGYGLQPVRLCYHLLSAPKGQSVSLEYIDDIAIHEPNGKITLEQTKSALSGNPANDRSPELWKTLANWADLFLLGHANIDSADLCYFVTPLKTGSLVEKLHSTTGDEGASELLKHFKSRRFQKAPGKGIEPEIKRFLNAGDYICLTIIKMFTIKSMPDPIEPIRQKLISVLPEETIDAFCAVAIGMAKNEVEELIRDKKPPIINAGQYRARFRAFVRKYDFSKILVPTVEAPSSKQVSDVLKQLPIFVRQLTSIDASETLITIAVSDYLRATADKVNWAADGDIVEDSLDDLDNSLLRHHLNGKDEIEDVFSDLSPKQQGRHIYRKCIALEIPLEGRPLPSYFIPGEYNSLADDCRLGWHPDHAKIFPSG
jgi:hypothetical protein